MPPTEYFIFVTKSLSLSSNVINAFAGINLSEQQSAPVTQNISGLQAAAPPPPRDSTLYPRLWNLSMGFKCVHLKKENYIERHFRHNSSYDVYARQIT